MDIYTITESTSMKTQPQPHFNFSAFCFNQGHSIPANSIIFLLTHIPIPLKLLMEWDANILPIQ